MMIESIMDRIYDDHSYLFYAKDGLGWFTYSNVSTFVDIMHDKYFKLNRHRSKIQREDPKPQ